MHVPVCTKRFGREPQLRCYSAGRTGENNPERQLRGCELLLFQVWAAERTGAVLGWRPQYEWPAPIMSLLCLTAVQSHGDRDVLRHLWWRQ